jgi:tripartite-type tricarboxylate transporter receptor subunit TctC
MKPTRRILQCAAAACLATMTSVAAAQDFPSRPITFVVPFPAGGVTDPVARMVAQKVSESVHQPVVVDNRPGAASIVGAMVVKNARPDGYTLFFGNFSSHAINSALYTTLPYDPVKDFEPITMMMKTGHLLVVPASSPAKSAKELIALAKSSPNGLTYGSQGIGSGGHILGEMWKLQTGAPLTHVPYKGSAPVIQDLLAERVDMSFDTVITSGPFVRDGKFRALGWSTSSRTRHFPDVPTMAEAGFPGMELEVWFALFATGGTPQPIVRKLNQEFVKAINSPDVMTRFGDQGLEMLSSTPEELAALVKADTARLAPIVKASGARVD